MTALRSLVFNIYFLLGTAAWAVALLPTLILPRPVLRRAAQYWALSIGWMLRVVVGARVEIRGSVPSGARVVAAKHQSVWETLALYWLLDDAAYVLKRELTWIPIFGWYLRKNRQIVVDRGGGARALKGVIAQAARELKAGRQVVIFPQGTRVAPGDTRPYQPGAAALYAHLGVPVTPVALNSGLVWGRRSFIKRPGRIVLEFLDPIAPGLDRKAFAAELERRIETASDRLLAEARPGGNQGGTP